MTEKQFLLNDDLSDLQDCKCVMDNYVDVDTWYTLGATVDLLNELNDENKELKEEIIKWKSKYFEAMDTVINEYSTNIKEDMEKLKKEVWGDVE